VIRSQKKPAVPSGKFSASIGDTSASKNFIVSNAVDVIVGSNRIKRAVQKPQPTMYRNKPEFGKVPGYLDNVKQEIDNEKAVLQEYFDESCFFAGPATESMAEADRGELVKQLKRKWGQINRLHAASCGGGDSMVKIRNRERYEKQLKQLENDIKTLSASGPIKVVLDR